PAHASDLEHVPEPARGDEADGPPPVLDDGIGDHGRPMGAGGPRPRLGGEGRDPVEHAFGGIGRRGGHLARLHPPRGIPRDDVRERPAHVHAYPHALSHALCLLSWATFWDLAGSNSSYEPRTVDHASTMNSSAGRRKWMIWPEARGMGAGSLTNTRSRCLLSLKWPVSAALRDAW